MKKTCFISILLIGIIIFVGCSGSEDPGREEQVTSQESYFIEDIDTDRLVDSLDTGEETREPGDSSLEDDGRNGFSVNELQADNDNEEKNTAPPVIRDIYYSPFSGEAVAEFYLRKALMVIVENSPAARPQSGLDEASIIYEFLVEGGITRFLALYWDRIPDKIGPVRSARPYFIDIAKEYSALLLHAGASPAGFAMLAEGGITHLDQIYNGQYYWRSSDRRAPHNLYTGSKRIENYLDQLLGQEYKERFNFQRVSFIKPDDIPVDFLKIPLWGGTTIIYKYNKEENQYYRYYGFMETPHLLDNNNQITANNIIIQFTKTRAVDDIGRLEMNLEGSGRALLFKNGIVIEGFWKKDGDSFTHYYSNNGESFELNPGQTWIQVVPTTINVEYNDSNQNDKAIEENQQEIQNDKAIEENQQEINEEDIDNENFADSEDDINKPYYKNILGE